MDDKVQIEEDYHQEISPSKIKILEMESESDYKLLMKYLEKIFVMFLVYIILFSIFIGFWVLFNLLLIKPFMSVTSPFAQLINVIIISGGFFIILIVSAIIAFKRTK